MDELRLTNGHMRLALNPAMGGAIAGWWHKNTCLLRPVVPGPKDVVSVRDQASYPLMPFSNRVAWGRFSFGGVDYALSRDHRETRHALHGNALYADWEIAEASAMHALLRLHAAPERQDMQFFPFRYEAEQLYELWAGALHVRLRITNRDAKPFPAGMGHHLFLPRAPETKLSFVASAMWENDGDMLPAAPSTVWREAFAAGKRLGDEGFDHCFEDWAGTARIEYPQLGYGLALEASAALGHAVLFTPKDKPFFAFEPVSHLNDAFNRGDDMARHGVRILNPGETLEGWFSLTYLPCPA